MYRVAVISLGDLGRIPRMQYHAYSLSKLDDVQEVSLIGYTGENCMQLVQNQDKIKIIRFSVEDKIPSFISKIPFIRTIAKGIMIVVQMLLILFSLNLSTLNAIIIQNPPCTPAAVAAIFLSCFYRIKIVIDWHNLGFKMFEEKLGTRHIFVKVSKVLEFLIAHASTGHICVAQTMKVWLQDNMFIHPQVVYDRPAHIFNRDGTDLQSKHELFIKLGLTDSNLFPRVNIPIRSYHGKSSVSTVSTEILSSSSSSSSGQSVVVSRGGDSAHVLVTSTSWTPDEDFPSLLEAMIQLDEKLRAWNESAIQKYAVSSSSSSSSSSFKTGHNAIGSGGGGGGGGANGYQRVLLLITGKGPLKEAFMARVQQLEANGTFTYVAIRSLWLEPHGEYIYLIVLYMYYSCLSPVNNSTLFTNKSLTVICMCLYRVSTASWCM